MVKAFYWVRDNFRRTHGIIAGCILLLLFVLFFIFSSSQKEQPKPTSLLVQTEIVKKKTFLETIDVYGVIEFSSDRLKVISTPNPSIVEDVLVKPGDLVDKDQVLLELSSTAQMNLTLEKAKTSVVFAQKELDRLIRLREQHLATNTQVQQAQKNIAQATATLETLKQQNKNYRSIKAPHKSIITAVYAKNGQLLTPSSPLLELGAVRNLQVRLEIPSSFQEKVHKGQKIQFQPLEGSHQGISVINHVMHQIQKDTDSFSVFSKDIGNLDYSPGTKIMATVFLSAPKVILGVPRASVISEEGKHFVYVIQKNHAVKKDVQIGNEYQGSIEILKGLQEGEEVIVKGSAEAQPNIKIQRYH